MKSIRISKRAPLLTAAFAAFAFAPSDLAAQGTVVGGSNNAAPGGISVVVGGAKNRSIGGGSVVVGGNTNKANGQNSAIVTGFQNTTSAAANFSGIVAGSNNLISGPGSMIGSGNKNTASGLSTIVVGGTDNTCAGQFSVIAGGRGNTLNATESFLFGNDINYTGSHTGIVYLADNSRGGTPENESFGANLMIGRFANGYRLYTDSNVNTGLRLTSTECRIDTSLNIVGDAVFDGRVGIGTTNPTRAKLEVVGFVNINNGGGTFINAFGAPTTQPTNFGGGSSGSGSVEEYSIFASSAIGSGSNLFIISDGRTKRIVGRSDGARDLSTILDIEITDYTNIDTFTKGGGLKKKVIAQQVEEVYPQAINRHTGVVPDIYKKAAIADGWIQLKTNLKVGERVRLIGEKEEGIYEVLEVKEGAFRTAFKPDGEELVVYGREVEDVRAVDYDAIAMLNVSATQELARKLEAKDAEIAKLKAEKDAEIAKLHTANETLAGKFAELLARDTAREERLARLEQSLEDAARTVSVPVALKVAK